MFSRDGSYTLILTKELKGGRSQGWRSSGKMITVQGGAVGVLSRIHAMFSVTNYCSCNLPAHLAADGV